MLYYLLPLLGGVLIGAAASLLWIGLGRRAGVSGMVGDVLLGAVRDDRIAFVVGLVATGVVASLVVPGAIVPSSVALPVVVLAGLLTGFGTRLGSGCTSGHGVCGVSRFSSRSIVATLVFMATGMATVFVTRHLLASPT